MANDKQWRKWAVTLILWISVGILLYPLLTLDQYGVMTMTASNYLIRTTLGIALMIILLGRNVFDMFLPQAYSKKTPLANTVLLVLYSLAIAAGIIIMIARLMKLYLNSLGSEISL